MSFEELLEKLQLGDESVEIEAKRGGRIDTSVLQTVSAFSNEPGRGGGYILVGVVEDQPSLFGGIYHVVGVQDPAKIQADLATRCRNDLTPPVRPQIDVEQHEGRSVLVVFVPEAAPGDKPVHIRSEGLPRGAYRRIGSTDQHCTDDDLAVLYQNRSTTTYDATRIEGSSFADLDPDALAEYRRQRTRIKPDAGELRFNNEELLFALGATANPGSQALLTIAGMMLFGRESSLRRYFPMVRVDYIRVEGREWVPDPEKRFAAVELRGPLLTLIPRIVAQVLDDIPKAFALVENEIHRRDVPLIPRMVIREAVVNALMHRTYRVASPVQIIRYSNRIEIRNPGASLVAEDRLGEPGSFPRNEKIAAVLHEVGLAETKGTGIRAMRSAMHQANLTPPLFESDRQRDEFRVMLLVHHLLSPEDVAWLGRFKALALSAEEARALVVIREAGAITNAMFRDINSVDTLTASAALRRLRDAGLLEQRGKGRATYYLPTPSLLGNGGDPISPLSPGFNLGDKAQSPGFTALSPGEIAPRREQAPEIADLSLPAELSDLVRSLGGRASPDSVKSAIIRLCSWRPFRAAELAGLLSRNAEYLQKHYLSMMVRDGLLEHTEPNLADPQQAYRATARPKGKSRE